MASPNNNGGSGRAGNDDVTMTDVHTDTTTSVTTSTPSPAPAPVPAPAPTAAPVAPPPPAPSNSSGGGHSEPQAQEQAGDATTTASPTTATTTTTTATSTTTSAAIATTAGGAGGGAGAGAGTPDTASTGSTAASPEPLASRDADPDVDDGDGFDLKTSQYGCQHYRRRCRMVAPCCGEVFWCRVCHDNVKDRDCTDYKTAHTVDRTKIVTIVCALCGKHQKPARQCVECNGVMGRYFCGHCNLFDDDTSKLQYHCDDCGICRVGGRANMQHCKGCNVCNPKTSNHTCLSGAWEGDCCVCLEPLFNSRKPGIAANCGHVVHLECQDKLLKSHRVTCPLCNKYMVDAGAITAHIDMQMPMWVMPHEYSNYKREILCNECQVTSIVPFHVLGHKCQACGMYNTSVTREINDPPSTPPPGTPGVPTGAAPPPPPPPAGTAAALEEAGDSDSDADDEDDTSSDEGDEDDDEDDAEGEDDEHEAAETPLDQQG